MTHLQDSPNQNSKMQGSEMPRLEQLFFEVPNYGKIVPIAGDMIGDTPLIGKHHLCLAERAFLYLDHAVVPAMLRGERVVVTVAGPSGSGKSETASLVAGYLQRVLLENHRPERVYTLSCDNWPKLPPRDNERHREELYREGGEAALVKFLGEGGSEGEIYFDRLSRLIADFKCRKDAVALRIIDNPGNKVADDSRRLDTAGLAAIVMEGTWSTRVKGADFRIFLYCTPEETAAHRAARKRDPLTPFGELVLKIEQAKLEQDKSYAHLVINRRYESEYLPVPPVRP